MGTKEIINKKFDKYIDSVQTNKGLTALADIKVLIQRFHEVEHFSDEDIFELIEKIEKKCIKLGRNKFIQKITKTIKEYFEERGRDVDEGFTNFRELKNDLIESISEILEEAKIPANYEAVSRLRID